MRNLVKETIANYLDWKTNNDIDESNQIEEYANTHRDNPAAEVIISWYENLIRDSILESDLANLA